MAFLIVAGRGLNIRKPLIFMLILPIFPTATLLLCEFNVHVFPTLSF